MSERFQFQLRRDNAADWASLNPVLAEGEPGVVIDAEGQPRSLKIGTGFTPWNSLDFLAVHGDVADAVEAAESAYADRVLAQTAATTATGAAASATAARDQAVAARDEAVPAAATATSQATLATTAKTDAQTARTDAQTARTGAETARTGAETARTGAEAAQAGIPIMPVIATNYLANPSFETNTTGWSVQTGASITRITSGPGIVFGGACGQAIITTANTSAVYVNNAVTGLVAGRVYTFSGWITHISGAATNLNLVTRDSSGTLAQFPFQPLLITGTPVWVSMSWTHTTGTTGTAQIARVGTAASDVNLQIDGMMVTEGNTAQPFFDGSQPGARWVGAAHASQSQLVQYRPTDVTTLINSGASAAVATHVAQSDPHPQYALDTDLAVIGRNLIWNPRAANLTAPTGIATTNGTFSQLTGVSIPGAPEITTAPRLTATTTGSASALYIGRNQIPDLVSGVTYYAGAWVRGSDAGDYTVRVVSNTSGVSNAVVTLVANTWTWVVIPTFTQGGGPSTVISVGLVRNGSTVVSGATMEIVPRFDTNPVNSYMDGSTPGARWSGTAHNSVTEQVSWRALDVAVAGRYYEGTGIPEGVVSAPIGATYADVAGTNGAWTWRKQSGVGNTGWVVSDGDTGWRQITSWTSGGVVTGEALSASWSPTSGSAGVIRVRRVNWTVEVYIVGLTRVDLTSANVWSAFALPTGMRPRDWGIVTYVINTAGAAAQIGVDANGNLARSTASSAGSSGALGVISWTYTVAATASWPTTLPGTPV